MSHLHNNPVILFGIDQRFGCSSTFILFSQMSKNIWKKLSSWPQTSQIFGEKDVPQNLKKKKFFD